MTGVVDVASAARHARPQALVARDGLGGSRALRPVVLSASDVPRVSDLHERVCAEAAPDTVRHDPPEFFLRVASGEGALLGFEGAEDGRLAAYGVVTLPGPETNHCGRLIGLAEGPLVAQLNGVAVDPSLRGNGLQRHLGRWRMATAARLGRRHVVSTASPHNVPSWVNLLSLGLVIRGLHVTYGALRYVLHADLEADTPRAAIRPVGLDDLAGQRTLLAAGWAGVGWTGGRRPEALLFADLTGTR